ncbi:hypothetical protein AVEN_124205-1 [Araneus ventricosus]|uniref:Uncharacterized protein n=1 Tax=Araneus ventricosus TaxID=182803 RepID=A0A4Y2HT18_ARAVE|nr:hypothetical protein AVEN_124205-1 [Araneus ventricosus]
MRKTKLEKLFTQTEISITLHFSIKPIMKNSLGQYVLKSTWQGFNRSYEDMDRTPSSNSLKQESKKGRRHHFTSILHLSITSSRTNPEKHVCSTCCHTYSS